MNSFYVVCFMFFVIIECIEICFVDLLMICLYKLLVVMMYGQMLMFVKVFCSDGVIGIGEGMMIVGMVYGLESLEVMKFVIDVYFVLVIVGCDVMCVQMLMVFVGKFVKVNYFVKSVFEIVLFDVYGKWFGVLVSELFGGCCCDCLLVVWMFVLGDMVIDIVEVECMFDVCCYNVFKLKIGVKVLEMDIWYVVEIKKVVGDCVLVCVDVNMVWSEMQVVCVILVFVDVGCELVEQLVVLVVVLVCLMCCFFVVLMVDEILQGFDSVFDIVKQYGVDVFVIKIEQSGGFFVVQCVVVIVDVVGIELYGGMMFEGVFSMVVFVYLFVSIVNLQWGIELFGLLLIIEEILMQLLDYSDFELIVLDGFGFGIVFDEDKVRCFICDGLMKVVW